MRKRVSVGTVVIVYVVVGIVFAVARHYITIGLLKGIGSALLAILLWWLPLLGISLHIH